MFVLPLAVPSYFVVEADEVRGVCEYEVGGVVGLRVEEVEAILKKDGVVFFKDTLIFRRWQSTGFLGYRFSFFLF